MAHIGMRFTAPLADENRDAYAQAAEWCNSNGARITDMGEYYIVEEIPAPTAEEEATERMAAMNATANRLEDLENAVMELAAIIAGE